jgi:hypothetical protein
MATEYDFNLEHVTLSEETSQRIREALAAKGTALGGVGAVSVEVGGGTGESSSQVPAGAAAEPMAPGTSVHLISTELYVDSGGHVHVATFDEHITPSGTVLEVLSDVPIN